ncbi:hypothetical protein JNK13_11960 [bacterium]|nr:hypothetical protein [bacterium]
MQTEEIIPNKTAQDSDSNHYNNSPLDRGISWSLHHLHTYLLLATVPMLLELVSVYFIYSKRIELQTRVLVMLATALANAWALVSINLANVRLARGEQPAVSQIAQEALTNLPKSFFSYTLVGFFVVAGIYGLIFPGIIILMFLIWSPAFTSAEIVLEKFRKPASDEDQQEELDRNLFSNRPLFDLGFGRSSRLSARSLQIAFQVALILIASALIPLLVVNLLLHSSNNLTAQILRSCVSSLSSAIGFGIWSATFISLLPAPARHELSLQREFYDFIPTFRFDGRGPLVGLLILLTIVSGFFEFQRLQLSTAMPIDARVKKVEVLQKNGELVVGLELSDGAEDFRWLNPWNYQLKLRDKELSAERVVVSDSDGKVLEPESLAPHADPLLVYLYFVNVPGVTGDDFEVNYPGTNSKQSVVLKDKLP